MIKGFTCGAMDLLHAGHLQMLKECRKHCDYLIVGLQTDPTIDRPNKNKPIETLEERAERLYACRYVDEVIVYSTEAELLVLLEKLNPDVRFLGEDWRNGGFTGEKLPIKTIFTSRQHSYSSSNLRKRISEAETAGGFEVYAFDMDGTLTESKESIDAGMGDLLKALGMHKKIAVISGASYDQMITQLLVNLPVDFRKKIYMLPTNGATMYSEPHALVYKSVLTDGEKQSIFSAFEQAMKHLDIFHVIYGKLIEDRGAQITFSGKGSAASLEVKREWDPTRAKRQVIANLISPLLPEFSISIAGTTSIDVTKKGIDKAYGMKCLAQHLNIDPSRIFYVGDSLFPGGNDEVVKQVVGGYAEVKNVEDTKSFIRHLLSKVDSNG